MKKAYLSLIAVVLVFLGCSPKSNDNVITMACNLPMSGYVGIYGEWMKRGIDMAMLKYKDTLNMCDIKINIDFQDNQGDNKSSVNILQKQLLNKPDVYFSGLTGQSMSIIDQVKQKEIPHFLMSFTPLFLKEGDMNFRPFPNFGVEVMHYLDYINDKKPNKIAFLYLDIIGTNIQFNDVIIPQLNENTEVFNEKYALEATDFKAIASKIKRFNPDVIIVNGFYNNLINIINSFNSYEVNMDNMMCSMDLLDAVEGLSKEQLEGLTVTAPAYLIESQQTQLMRDWNDTYRNTYTKQPAYFEAYAYDMMTAICEAAIISKNKRQSLYRSLYDVDIDGVTGEIKFNNTGDINHNMFTVKYRNKELIVD